jgi:hypothetical protein
MLALAKYPEMLTAAAQDFAPHDVTFYLRDLAAAYHSYYDAERILVDDEAVKRARLALVAATAQVLHNGLAVLGVSAPAEDVRDKMRQAQHGGTFLGIIIGVVIGLAGALAVAIYVTKVPVPFMNKGQPRKAEQDAAEAQQEQGLGPERALVWQEPGAARLGSQRAGCGARCGGRVRIRQGCPTGRQSASRRSPAQTGGSRNRGDPLGDLAKSKSGATADPFTYLVQAGAFRTPEDAEAQRAKLSLMGVEAKVTEREQSGRTVYRVRVGPFDNKEAADRMKERIDAGGMESTLVRVQR